MDVRFYQSETLDLERLATDLEQIYRTQGYISQQLGTAEQKVVQLKKGSDFELLLGLQSAVTITLQRSGGGTVVSAGQQKWLDKAAVGFVGVAVPVLWPLLITAGFGAIRQAGLASQVLGMVDNLARQQQPDVQMHQQQQGGFGFSAGSIFQQPHPYSGQPQNREPGPAYGHPQYAPLHQTDQPSAKEEQPAAPAGEESAL